MFNHHVQPSWATSYRRHNLGMTWTLSPLLLSLAASVCQPTCTPDSYLVKNQPLHPRGSTRGYPEEQLERCVRHGAGQYRTDQPEGRSRG